MENLTPQNITVMLLSLAILIAIARILGELAQWLHQPAVLGELLAGILLGPTILGNISPELSAFLFPPQGLNSVVLDAFSNLAIVFFLMVAGIEVDLSTIWKQGKVGAKIGIISIVIPFLCGLVTALLVAKTLGRHPKADPLIFSLFLATAMSISALPIIAKTLMDLDLYRSDLGMTVISAAIFNDLVGWIGFAVVTSLLGNAVKSSPNILMIIGLTLAFAIGTLTLGRWAFHKIMPFVQAYAHWPGGELSFALVLSLFGAALTEWIGIHAIFGAFFVGAAMGDSSHLREHTRVTIDHFVSYVFAPIFFANIGLKVNFWTHFDLLLVVTIILIACSSKIIGGSLGALWGGLQLREAWSVGFAMVSVGAMGIIVGLTALKAAIIHPTLFVAIVVMAMISSMISGPAIRLILKPPEKWKRENAFSAKLFMKNLKARKRRDVIDEMVQTLCKVVDLDVEKVQTAVWAREEALSTGIGNEIALPHARIDGEFKPLVAVGISNVGIDFDAPDDRPAKMIFLIITPGKDPGIQLTITSELVRLFRNPGVMDRILNSKNYTDFLALMRTSIKKPA
jgi:Kef-type K+ transport system membrane component KefB